MCPYTSCAGFLVHPLSVFAYVASDCWNGSQFRPMVSSLQITQCVFYFNVQDEVECTAPQVTANESVAELEIEQPDRGVDTIQVHSLIPYTWNI